jgi:LPXTG-site transpeptidase (sortase) family protein
MYSRRSRTPLVVRVIFGLFTIVIAIGAVALFQTVTTRAPDGPIPTPTPAAQAIRATPTLIPTGKAVTYRIISDKAGLSTSITQLYFSSTQDNWDLTYLGGLAGHLQGTPNLGEGGNFVLAGHVELKDGGKGPFANIHLMRAGDGITIIGDQVPNPSILQYIVTDVKKVQPQDFGVMRNHGYEELTLITCDDWDQKSASYQTRIIVHARPAAAVLRLTNIARTNTPNAVTSPTPQPTLRQTVSPTRRTVQPSPTRGVTLIPTRPPLTPTRQTAKMPIATPKR